MCTSEPARQVEDHAAARRRRLSHCRRRRRRGGAGRDQDRHYAFVAVGVADHLYGMGLPAGRIASPDPGGCVKLLYFAWVRERLGKAEERVGSPARVFPIGGVVKLVRVARGQGEAQERLPPPPSVATVDELMTWLAGRDEQYAHAFENAKVIRAAIDHRHVRADAPIAGAREIAFFPPMTGG